MLGGVGATPGGVQPPLADVEVMSAGEKNSSSVGQPHWLLDVVLAPHHEEQHVVF